MQPGQLNSPATVVDSKEEQGDAKRIPLVVDLDGTLLRTDSLVESLLMLARTKPFELWKPLVWLAHGRARLKHQLAENAVLDVHTLLYRSEVLTYLRAEKRNGRFLVLATGADERLAREVATELGVFDAVFASDGVINLSGEHKGARLAAEFGAQGFDYIGNSRRDLPVWRKARKAMLVSDSRLLAGSVAQAAPIERVFAQDRASLADYVHAMRPHHWIKNALLLVPLAAARLIFNPQLFMQVALAFMAFSLCASSVYLLNDLLDLPSDRRHPQKKERKLASGRMPLTHALALWPLLAAAAFAIGAQLPAAFVAALGGYLLLMLAYSFGLKNAPILDVLMLACGYALRVAAGAVAAGILLSTWLLAFCVFIFLSLALIKRYAELVLMKTTSAPVPRARGYLSGDEVILVAEGVASGYLGVLVLALYTSTELAKRVDAQGELFWAICLLLLYWISYMWLSTVRGRMHHDPVVFALKDRVSLCSIAAMAIIAFIAM